MACRLMGRNHRHRSWMAVIRIGRQQPAFGDAQATFTPPVGCSPHIAGKRNNLR